MAFYADDAAVLVEDSSVLPEVHRIFREFERATGLALNASKCIVVPLRCHDMEMEDNCRRYAAEVARLVPEWAQFKCVGSAKYLDCEVGPSVSPLGHWRAALIKHDDRAKVMASAGVPPPAALHYYDVYVRPVLSYIAQVSEVPHEALRAHDLAAQRLLHLPHRALPRSFGTLLEVVGLKPMRCPRAKRAAMLLQAAARHADDVAACAEELRAARVEYGSLASLADGAPPAEGAWWRTRAVADLMQEALRAAEMATTRAACGSDGGVRRRQRRGPQRCNMESIVQAATALRPRIRRFVSSQIVPDALLDVAVSKTLESLSKCAPAFGTAVLRTWA